MKHHLTEIAIVKYCIISLCSILIKDFAVTSSAWEFKKQVKVKIITIKARTKAKAKATEPYFLFWRTCS